MEISVELAAELLAVLFPGENSGTPEELATKIHTEVVRLKRAEAENAELRKRCERLEGALVTSAIPLEVLLGQMPDSLAIEVRDAIRDAVVAIRAALGEKGQTE